ncbi:MAG: hypothetical protein ACPLRW_07125 [Moorellales bacterium]
MAYADRDKVKMLKLFTAAEFQMTDAEFDTFLDTLLNWASAAISSYCHRTYSADELAADATLAATLESVTVRMVVNYLLVLQQAKTAPIVRVDDFAVRFTDRRVFTDDLKEELRPYIVHGGPSYELPSGDSIVAPFV